ncbi:PREDICTED: ADP-ribosylation factor-related protein 1 isoform X1 [Tarenaya hassleriana]|uniref:ADP-ribosylation factor-related protein 1 isoform X1 n=1 Tax=Tarenaya hassleriana TaxID=28532 RepID=UPI00053C8065|nr:PREDICTED: ADP-ribosylation factor-related protein 1 isoform X1 [Tarenaya hassleriana]XP_010521341.1 PREDICTED: ADP-ribosylation factor-related protein 1 isoform X1 [Tarenaya hassleriana]XP_010521342.1 PREDICTED: ADP-ribosylation factor-related protein 1 isoform X1 [Tarenaya hassleriana]
MFSLIYGMWKYMFSKTEFHVLILGIDKAGKTTFLEKLKSIYSISEGLPPDRIVPTVGLNIGRIEISNTKIVFWDLGGQPGLRSIWEKYYEEAHALIYLIDAACPSRFEDSKSALEKALRHEDLRGAPLLIMANKQDLPSAVSAEELDRYLDLKKLDERVYMFEAVSGFDGEMLNLQERNQRKYRMAGGGDGEKQKNRSIKSSSRHCANFLDTKKKPTLFFLPCEYGKLV